MMLMLKSANAFKITWKTDNTEMTRRKNIYNLLARRITTDTQLRQTLTQSPDCRLQLKMKSGELVQVTPLQSGQQQALERAQLRAN